MRQALPAEEAAVSQCLVSTARGTGHPRAQSCRQQLGAAQPRQDQCCTQGSTHGSCTQAFPSQIPGAGSLPSAGASWQPQASTSPGGELSGKEAYEGRTERVREMAREVKLTSPITWSSEIS